MKRLLVAAVATAVICLAVSASTAPAATDYRIPLVACADGGGTWQVPANTPLYFSAGWTTGTRGLVQDAINSAVETFTYTSNGITTTPLAIWGPIAQDNNIFQGSWTARFRVDFPQVAIGQMATVTWTSAFAHPLADLGLPTSNSGGTGLLYFDLVPTTPTVVTCTVTGV
jgi:hypothetical protein